MQRQVDISSYQPPVVADTREFQALAAAESPELTRAWDGTEEVLQNQFVLTASEYGLRKWEELLDILRMPEDTTEFRRQRILYRLQIRPPFSIRFLRQQLDAMLGADNYELRLDHGAYTLHLRILGDALRWNEEAFILLGWIRPANIALDYALQWAEWSKCHLGALGCNRVRVSVPPRFVDTGAAGQTVLRTGCAVRIDSRITVGVRD